VSKFGFAIESVLFRNVFRFNIVAVPVFSWIVGAMTYERVVIWGGSPVVRVKLSAKVC